MALPPYLMTTVLPWKRRMYGKASERTSALTVAECWISVLVMSLLMSAQSLVHGSQKGFLVVVAQITPDDVALLIYKECGGGEAHVAKLAGDLAGGVNHHLERELARFSEVLHVVRRIILHGYGDGVVAAILQCVVVFDVIRHLGHAGDTACRPEL